MKFASPEIREKAVRAYLDGKGTARQLADIFGYTPTTICNWVRAYRETQQLAAKPNGHRKSCFTDEELIRLKEVISETPDITLQEIKTRFNKSCCLAAICRIVAKLGFTYKKNSQGKRTGQRGCKAKKRKMADIPDK